jgi:H+-transporting ATPase
MEVAAILAVILQDWVDFGLIVALLFLNASIGYWEEHASGNAISALKDQLTPVCKCVRDGNVNREMKSADLVPGDVILLRLGDVVPADATLFEGDFLKIDQSALTGESLPATKYKGDGVYSSSIGTFHSCHLTS